MPQTADVPENGGHGGFTGLMDDLMDGIKEKLSESKLHDAKVALIHKKSVVTPCPPRLGSHRHTVER